MENHQMKKSERIAVKTLFNECLIGRRGKGEF